VVVRPVVSRIGRKLTTKCSFKLAERSVRHCNDEVVAFSYKLMTARSIILGKFWHTAEDTPFVQQRYKIRFIRSGTVWSNTNLWRSKYMNCLAFRRVLSASITHLPWDGRLRTSAPWGFSSYLLYVYREYAINVCLSPLYNLKRD
jgi:hypothetical protein